MRVKWTVEAPLWKIPERFWGEDLSPMDKHYEGDVIDTTTDWLFGDTELIVACSDDKVRKVSMNKVTII